jgi:LysM repeat protein
MARRQPSHPDWEKPPRLDNFPRLRAREDRNNNQPLLLAAMGVAVVMVALILLPLLTGNGVGTGPKPTASGSLIAGGPSSSLVTDTPVDTPVATATMKIYFIHKNDTLQHIADNNNISLQLLIAANVVQYPNLAKNPNIIQIGQRIQIPPPDWVPPTPVPTPTPTAVATPTPKTTIAPTATY